MAVFAYSFQQQAPIPPVFTEDADLLLERRRHQQKTLSNDSLNTLSEVLENHGYEAIPTNRTFGNDLHWEKWEKKDSSYHIEFLTFDNKKNRHEISGVIAQGLKYFSMSLDFTTEISLLSGHKIKVALPEVCILHKALTFKDRAKKEKKFKDLYYVCYISLNIFDSTDEMIEAVTRLKVHENWKKKRNRCYGFCF